MYRVRNELKLCLVMLVRHPRKGAGSKNTPGTGLRGRPQGSTLCNPGTLNPWGVKNSINLLSRALGRSWVIILSPSSPAFPAIRHILPIGLERIPFPSDTLGFQGAWATLRYARGLSTRRGSNWVKRYLTTHYLTDLVLKVYSPL